MPLEFSAIFQKLNAYIQTQSIDMTKSPQNELLLQFAFNEIDQAPFEQKAILANHYGASFHRLNHFPFAIQCFLKAISFSPPLISALSNLGLTYLDQNQFTEGIQYLEQAYEQFPTNEIHANNLLSAYISAGKIEKGLVFAKALISHASIKHTGLIFHNYGQILSKIGLGEEAQRLLNKAYELGQRGIHTENNRLYQLLFHELDANQIAQAHLAWGEHMNESYATPDAQKRKKLDQQPKPKYRLAFISPDFRVHSVAYFFKSLRFDLFFQDFEIICYYHYHLFDHVTQEIKNQADAFYQINYWDDQTLLQHIQAQSIDIVIDLAGHTAGNRLSAFAQRLAPIQITWLGYPATTGLKTMDYRLVDRLTDSKSSESWHSEKLIYLRSPFICYTPPKISIEPQSKPIYSEPSADDKVFYFASFNNPSKISELAVALWAEILKRLPFAKLKLKGTGLEQEEIQNIQKQRFKKYGISEDQLIFLARTDTLLAHYECYQAVDLALDTFPYCGTTTTCEALWMGVPVLTLVGQSHVSRVGYSLLSSVKLDDFIAFSVEEYVQKAVFWASPENRALIYALKEIIRPQLLQSPLCDQISFSVEFEAKLKEILQAQSS